MTVQRTTAQECLSVVDTSTTSPTLKGSGNREEQWGEKEYKSQMTSTSTVFYIRPLKYNKLTAYKTRTMSVPVDTPV